MVQLPTPNGFTVASILVADDDHLLRAVLRERLVHDGHDVLECGDGFAALEIATDEKPDCLVLDVMMPFARGLEVVRSVRRDSEWSPGIIMVSARTRLTDRLNALEAGADLYLDKPVAPDDLADAIDGLLADARPARIVDVLGAVWSAVAMNRMLRRIAAEPRTAAFTIRDYVSAQLGAALADVPRDAIEPLDLRAVWERSLRTLLTTTALDGPRPGAPEALRDHMAAQLRRALMAPPERAGTDNDLRTAWEHSLRSLLASTAIDSPIEAPSVARALSAHMARGRGCADPSGLWTTTLRTILATPSPERVMSTPPLSLAIHDVLRQLGVPAESGATMPQLTSGALRVLGTTGAALRTALESTHGLDTTHDPIHVVASQAPGVAADGDNRWGVRR